MAAKCQFCGKNDEPGLDKPCFSCEKRIRAGEKLVRVISKAVHVTPEPRIADVAPEPANAEPKPRRPPKVNKGWPRGKKRTDTPLGVYISFNVSERDAERLEALATKRNVSRSEVLRDLLLPHLREH